ncbi:hypothetical protein H5410_038222, partial [Solanum commersonii]
MKLYIDYKAIVHGCKVEFNGDWDYEVFDGKDWHTVNLKQKNKEAYMLTYKNKMQPIEVKSSGRLILQVGIEEPDEARKRKGKWTQSRKGTQMTSSNCGESNHKVRSCYKLINLNTKKNYKKSVLKIMHVQRKVKCQYLTMNVGPDVEAATQEFEPYGPNVENEEDRPLRSITRVVPTGARKIQFYGDHTDASVPTNLPYSLIKTTWKDKEAIFAGHVQMQTKNKRIKKLGVNGRGQPALDLIF